MEYREPTRTRHELVSDREQLPGCGLAAYVLVLLGMFFAGVTGVAIATANMFYTNDALSPTHLSYGGEVNPAMLGPLRAAGVLHEGETLKLYHAENMLGTEACGATDDTLVRLGPEGGRRVRLADIAEVTVEEAGVRVRYGGATPGELTCGFGEGEGGDKFARILQAKPEAPALAPAP